jgi:hypothetical protein
MRELADLRCNMAFASSLVAYQPKQKGVGGLIRKKPIRSVHTMMHQDLSDPFVIQGQGWETNIKLLLSDAATEGVVPARPEDAGPAAGALFDVFQLAFSPLGIGIFVGIVGEYCSRAKSQVSAATSACLKGQKFVSHFHT